MSDDLPPGYEVYQPEPPPPGYEPYQPNQQGAPDRGLPGYISDVGQNMATGILKGVGQLAGLPHTVAQIGDWGMDRDAMVRGYYDRPQEVPGEAPDYTPGQPGFITRHTYSPEEINRGIFGGISAASQATGGKPVQPYQPTTAGGRIGQAALEQVIPSLVGAPATAGGRMVAGMAAGAAPQAVEEADPSAPWWLKLGSSLAAGGAAGKLLAPAGTSPVADAYRRLDLEPLRADITNGPVTRFITSNVPKLPGAGGLRSQQERNLEGFANQIEDTAAGLGTSTNPQEAGAALQMEGENWLQNYRQAQRAAWNDVDLHVPPNTPVPVTNYASTLNNVRSQMPAAPATAGVLQSGLSRDLLDALIQDTRAGPLDWQSVRGIRTRIGEMLNDKNLIGDTGYADLRRIYGGLSTDLDQAVQPLGQQAVDAVNRASTLTQNGHDFIDNTLSRIVGNRNNPISPEQAYNAAMTRSNAGGSVLQSIRDEMPAGADELAAAKLRQMSLATPGTRAGQGAQTSPNTFLTNLNKLSPQANDALYGQNPALGDLRTVAGSMRDTGAYTNWSGTASASTVLHMLGGAGGFEAAKEAHDRGYSWPEAIGIGLGTAATSFMPGLLGSRIARNVPRPYAPGLVPGGAIPGLISTYGQ